MLDWMSIKRALRVTEKNSFNIKLFQFLLTLHPAHLKKSGHSAEHLQPPPSSPSPVSGRVATPSEGPATLLHSVELPEWKRMACWLLDRWALTALVLTAWLEWCRWMSAVLLCSLVQPGGPRSGPLAASETEGMCSDSPCDYTVYHDMMM